MYLFLRHVDIIKICLLYPHASIVKLTSLNPKNMEVRKNIRLPQRFFEQFNRKRKG
jgi:hypothetical protein